MPIEIQRFTISRDDHWYHAFPDLARSATGRLVCVYARCVYHTDRSQAGVMLQHSDDDGRTWTPPRPVIPMHRRTAEANWFWNCPRIVALPDGRLVAICDQHGGGETSVSSVFFWFSEDDGLTWSDAVVTSAEGIVPDRLQVLQRGGEKGRWLLAVHRKAMVEGQEQWQVRCWRSDDQGQSWSDPTMIASQPGLKLCEPTVFELPGGELVCLMRENSMEGQDAYKCVSRDAGVTWSQPIRFPLPGCHRPVGGALANGQVLVTYRFTQGPRGVGKSYQNCFLALTDVASCLAEGRKDCFTRIIPLDHDRSRACDTGYTGWVQLPDQSILIVNYILDDWPRGQIRGYRLPRSEFLLTGS